MHRAICILASVFALACLTAGSPTPIQEKDRRIGVLSRPDRERIIDRQDQDGPYTAKPYQFGFELEDGYGMSQYRSESADGSGAVKGSYGYMDPFGVYRKVEYTADDNGYRAVIRSNEPGTANQNVADALFIVEPPPESVLNQGIENDVNPRNAKA